MIDVDCIAPDARFTRKCGDRQLRASLLRQQQPSKRRAQALAGGITALLLGV
ncbi:hypothetical protein ACVOMV_27300 (plasmid) [Mesorhizobium atlanticum]